MVVAVHSSARAWCCLRQAAANSVFDSTDGKRTMNLAASNALRHCTTVIVPTFISLFTCFDYFLSGKPKKHSNENEDPRSCPGDRLISTGRWSRSRTCGDRKWQKPDSPTWNKWLCWKTQQGLLIQELCHRWCCFWPIVPTGNYTVQSLDHSAIKKMITLSHWLLSLFNLNSGLWTVGLNWRMVQWPYQEASPCYLYILYMIQGGHFTFWSLWGGQLTTRWTFPSVLEFYNLPRAGRVSHSGSTTNHKLDFFQLVLGLRSTSSTFGLSVMLVHKVTCSSTMQNILMSL